MFKTSIVGLFGLSLFCALPALAGPNGSGGGIDIESNFKAKTSAIFSEISSWSDRAKSEVRFDVESIRANLMAPNRFRPSCAQGERLNSIVGEQKLARVFDDTPTTVWLDCRAERNGQWQALFASKKAGEEMFFIHEAVRNDILPKALQTKRDPAESEDSYETSSSYLKGLAIARDESQKHLAGLLFPEAGDPRCQVKIQVEYNNEFDAYHASGGTALNFREAALNVRVSLMVDGALVNDLRTQDTFRYADTEYSLLGYLKFTKIERIFRARLADGTSTDAGIQSLRRKMLASAKSAGCLKLPAPSPSVASFTNCFSTLHDECGLSGKFAAEVCVRDSSKAFINCFLPIHRTGGIGSEQAADRCLAIAANARASQLPTSTPGSSDLPNKSLTETAIGEGINGDAASASLGR